MHTSQSLGLVFESDSLHPHLSQNTALSLTNAPHFEQYIILNFKMNVYKYTTNFSSRGIIKKRKNKKTEKYLIDIRGKK